MCSLWHSGLVNLRGSCTLFYVTKKDIFCGANWDLLFCWVGQVDFFIIRGEKWDLFFFLTQQCLNGLLSWEDVVVLKRTDVVFFFSGNFTSADGSLPGLTGLAGNGHGW